MTKTTKQYRTANSIIENIRKRLASEQRALRSNEADLLVVKARVVILNSILEDAEKDQPTKKGGPKCLTAPAVVTQPEPSALAKLLADPDRLKDFPIETVERLFVLDQQIRAETARCDFAVSFNRVQEAMSTVQKRGHGESSRYAKAEDVCSMLDPLIIAEGFSRSISTEPSETQKMIRFVLISAPH